MVVCSNKDNFHKDIFVRYIIVNGIFFDEPSFAQYIKWVYNHPNCKLVTVIATCRYCKARGCK